MTRAGAGTIAEMFRVIAARHSQRIAVSDGHRELSYRELDALSDNIAAGLRRATRPREPVAMLLDHTPLCVGALLGAVKAGLPYAFLPSNGVASEHEAIVRDLQPSLILADAPHMQQATSLAKDGITPAQIETMECTQGTPGQAVSREPSAPAAIYYTSGSTGTPKGVIRTHESILGRLLADIEAFPISPEDRLAQLRPLHVGASSSILFNALLRGAALLLGDPRAMNARALAAWLCDTRITVLTLPTPLMREMLQAIPPGLQFSDLRYCRLAGRTLKADLQNLWPHLSSRCIVGHGLASTEAALMTHISFRHGELPPSDVVPVGRPARGVELWIVDDDGAQVAAGICGEIVVSSPCVMAGYWDKNAGKRRGVASDPERDGCRIFHTGDVGRISADGMVEFVGRKDNRVKVRGFTVEIETVEAAMERLPGVTRAAVRTMLDDDGEARLIGYVETDADPSAAAPELRRRLAGQLPDYMIPFRLLPLRRMPLGPTGKVRLTALPDPGSLRSSGALPRYGHLSSRSSQSASTTTSSTSADTRFRRGESSRAFTIN